MGFLCTNMGLAYLEKSSTLMILYLCIRANSTNNSSLIGLTLVDFGYRHVCRLSELFSPWIPCSSQNAFCVDWKCHDIRPGYLQLLAFLFLLEACYSSQIVWEICFEILWSLVDWVFICLWVQLILWEFVSVLGGDPQSFQNFQVLGTRKCCVAARVYSFREVQLRRRSDLDRLAESYWGLPYLRSDYGEFCNLSVLFD